MKQIREHLKSTFVLPLFKVSVNLKQQLLVVDLHGYKKVKSIKIESITTFSVLFIST